MGKNTYVLWDYEAEEVNGLIISDKTPQEIEEIIGKMKEETDGEYDQTTLEEYLSDCEIIWYPGVITW